MRFLRQLTFVSLLLSSSVALAKVKAGDPAMDFPPGAFSDGGHYDLAELKGKVVVLLFFELDYPDNKEKVPEWNKLVEQFKEKPIKFLAIAPRNTLAKVQKYASETRLQMPIYADNLGLMEAEYGEEISMDGARSYRIIGPEGNVVGSKMTAEDIDKALADVSWKYKEKGYNDPKLVPIVNLLDWDQYQPAVKLLHPFVRKESVTPLAKSANKLYAAVKGEGEQWKTDADGLVMSDPVAAFDLYTKISAVFPTDELGRSVITPLRKLKAQKPVTDELAARLMYEQLYTTLPRAKGSQRDEAKQYCSEIATRYPDSPTGKKAAVLAATIMSTER